jgi:hypothetical protein
MADLGAIRDRLDASTWAGIGLLGLLVFVIGVVLPDLSVGKSLPDHAWLPIAVAVGGGVVAALGLGFAYDLREASRGPKPPPAREVPPDGSVAATPSFEIYRPSDDDGSPGRSS